MSVPSSALGSLGTLSASCNDNPWVLVLSPSIGDAAVCISVAVLTGCGCTAFVLSLGAGSVVSLVGEEEELLLPFFLLKWLMIWVRESWSLSGDRICLLEATAVLCSTTGSFLFVEETSLVCSGWK